MPDTPFFPALRACLGPMGSRTFQAVEKVRAFTLCQIEKCFDPWVPKDLFPKAPEKANSRDRQYTRWRTFWCLEFGHFSGLASCDRLSLSRRD